MHGCGFLLQVLSVLPDICSSGWPCVHMLLFAACPFLFRYRFWFLLFLCVLTLFGQLCRNISGSGGTGPLEGGQLRSCFQRSVGGSVLLPGGVVLAFLVFLSCVCSAFEGSSVGPSRNGSAIAKTSLFFHFERSLRSRPEALLERCCHGLSNRDSHHILKLPRRARNAGGLKAFKPFHRKCSTCADWCDVWRGK